MASSIIRIRPDSHKALKEIAQITGKSLQDALDQAIENQRRLLYLEGLRADYAALAENPKAMAEFMKEISAWDSTSKDGLGEL